MSDDLPRRPGARAKAEMRKPNRPFKRAPDTGTQASFFYSPCEGFAQSRRFQYLTAQDEVLQSGVQMPQWFPLQ
jgi:hypothetical protein